jgi:mRNA-degrading endonuclease YafQ of YafQ-DinJ toxin-antitoxin module|tara:strand:+ start:775 stop:969 length:195 start_codon:yes stop_codon:yes gene_type:complete
MTVSEAVKNEIAEMSEFQKKLTEQINMAEAQKERLSHLINALSSFKPCEEQLELDLGDKSPPPT